MKNIRVLELGPLWLNRDIFCMRLRWYNPVFRTVDVRVTPRRPRPQSKRKRAGQVTRHSALSEERLDGRSQESPRPFNIDEDHWMGSWKEPVLRRLDSETMCDWGSACFTLELEVRESRSQLGPFCVGIGDWFFLQRILSQSSASQCTSSNLLSWNNLWRWTKKRKCSRMKVAIFPLLEC